ncbi:UNVERIFIED_CONTAM: hypothetical protein GTU68_031030 [Idotea baltica]|nr:hypothetical protein [Idotea baltica]
MIEILVTYPLMLLFIVAALGYLVGRINIGGSSLGVAAVLFVGLGFGAIDPRLQIPEIILLLGLSLFVYVIGLSSGTAFFKAYQKKGLRNFSFVMATLAGTGAIAALMWLAFDFSAATITGIYSGSTTNTPALAGVVDYITNAYPENLAKGMVEDSVVGYSFSYVMGVMGAIIAIVVLEKVFRIDYKAEAKKLRKDYPVGEELSSATIEVTQEGVCQRQLRDLFKENDWNIVIGRIQHNGDIGLAQWSTTLEVGDLIMVVGNKEDLQEAIKVLGKAVDSTLDHNRSDFDVRRIFISNSRVVGRTVASLNLDEKYNAVITRLRRGDTEMLVHGNTILELGDRIRFIARREDLNSLSQLFGDSYESAAKVNLFSFGVGISLGLILGSITFSFGPDFSFKLGYAGGPLIVGLLLGALRRTGKVVWTLPFSANVTIQQLGLIFLLSAIGVRSGQAFIQSVSVEGIWIFVASCIISLATAFAMLTIGYKWLKLPFSLLIGMVANQPAILDFATSRSGNKIPLYGYAMVFPIALIAKIVISQILFLLLS